MTTFVQPPAVDAASESAALSKTVSKQPTSVLKPMSVLKPLLKIGELAKHTQVAVGTLRYYESLGLLHPVQRSSSGYRYYSSESIQQVDFIKKAQTLGFSLAEIQKILGVRAAGRPVYEVVKQMLSQKITFLSDEIQRLQTLRQQLQDCQERWQHETSMENYTRGICELIENVQLPTTMNHLN
jgi:DNA-binding transcriptional MerR regulator